MKFWELKSVLRDRPDILDRVFDNPRWKEYRDWYVRFDELVDRQDRAILDAVLPADLCREALGLETKRYRIQDDGILEQVLPTDQAAPEATLSALEVFERFGGGCMEEVLEYGCWRIQ